MPAYVMVETNVTDPERYETDKGAASGRVSRPAAAAPGPRGRARHTRREPAAVAPGRAGVRGARQAAVASWSVEPLGPSAHRSVGAASLEPSENGRYPSERFRVYLGGIPTVSRLSAAIPHAASLHTTAPSPATPVSGTAAVQSKVAKGLVNCCGWHGMQGVRSSNPLSSTPGQRPSPPSTTRESRRSRSRYAATASARPIRSSRAAVTRATVAGVVSR
jgi:hypothetical protein